jgi:hypothetical protein
MINSVLAAGVIGAPTPEVGMGATMLLHSDRHAYTIVGVEHFKSGARKGQVRTVYATRDQAVRVDTNGMSESQEWVFLPANDGIVSRFTLKKNGRYTDKGGATLAVGYRSEYYDFAY